MAQVHCGKPKYCSIQSIGYSAWELDHHFEF